MGRSVGDALGIFARPRRMHGDNTVDNDPFTTPTMSMQGSAVVEEITDAVCGTITDGDPSTGVDIGMACFNLLPKPLRLMCHSPVVDDETAAAAAFDNVLRNTIVEHRHDMGEWT
ncbi:hypothetical protein CYMTET_14677 [Cymbomonas tetramitiformis]|uniref:Uncharacterized protein n=1 Tax=Cymbomonas tetramitiformis TaxID=36881 RepID=A0AAE0GFL5_9CHLO|nr:hypothetical protein CYMTET_14677 [Cymbomonas tetramitiformis]